MEAFYMWVWRNARQAGQNTPRFSLYRLSLKRLKERLCVYRRALCVVTYDVFTSYMLFFRR